MRILQIHNEYFTSNADGSPTRSDSENVGIMWAGRMIPWKRTDVLVRAVAMLKRDGHAFDLTIIGDGPEKEKIIKLCNHLGLQDSVTFHASMSPSEVRSHMRSHDIYVLPSNGTEGWGAVLNECMSEGCLAAACQDVGAARVLIRGGVNGLLFRNGDCTQLSALLSQAIADTSWRKSLAQEGQHTIEHLWSSTSGAERLLALSKGLLGMSEMPHYEDGPCKRVG